MSWHFSRALEGVFLGASCSDGGPSAPLSLTSIAGTSSCSGKTMESLSHSQSGGIFGHSVGANGGELLTWFLAGFPVRDSALPHLDEIMLTTFGRTCGESWQMSLLSMCSPRTSVKRRSLPPLLTAPQWATKPVFLPFPRRTWVQITYGKDIGYVHTPTTKANYTAQSMQKWPCARNFTRVFGKPTPEIHEWLMGWPIGWSDTAPLATDRFRSWQQSHGIHSTPESND